ncbi:MAG: HAMP domain-containing protein [Prevotella sp.]|nr:HAMP domain-containing protein [Prevotella sp.]
MRSIIQKVRTSFTTQLTLWVASLVTVISVVVVGLLAMFSQDVIFDETVDMTLQAMETTALRIDNTLRQNQMSARLEGGRVRVNRAAIERLIEQNGCLAKLRQTLPNAELYVTRRDSSQLGIFIAGEQSGYRKLVHDDREMFIFMQPLGDRPFVLTAVCPAEDVYGRYSRMQWFLWFRGVAGVLILLIVLYIIVGRHLRPLHWLADSAQSIANGNLDTPIPDAHHEHEAGRLQNSLAKMQQALKAYMMEMQQKQVTLSNQNAELKTAYAEVQAYEEKKTVFVRDMTAQMAQPVERLCQEAETICRDAATMTREEIAQRQAVIMQDSETITQLLDKLMKETAL